MKDILNKQKQIYGFTLLEVIVALSIIAIAIIPISLLYFRTMKIITRASNKTKAVQKAKTLIECIKKRNFINVPLGNFSEEYFKECFFDKESKFKTSILITKENSGGFRLLKNNVYMKRISVSVFYLDSYIDEKKSDKVELICFISNYD